MSYDRERLWFGQNGFHIRFEWGRHGARTAAERGDVLILADVLCFGTAVATAVERGATIFPCGPHEDTVALAARWGAQIAVARQDVPQRGRFSLSPQTFLEAEAGTRVVLPSLNGATCTRYGSRVPRLYVGGLVNAKAIAEAAARTAAAANATITVLACGERWLNPTEDGELRFAAEDYLAAAAILSYLPPSLKRSPEAAVCQAGFASLSGRLTEMLRGCGSGVELIARGFPEDVEHSAQLDVYNAVPLLVDGVRLESETTAPSA